MTRGLGGYIMKSCEELVAPESDYFIYSPSMTAREIFFYPLYAGHFIYEAGYRLCRDTYNSFLLMYIQKGELTLEFDGKTRLAGSGSFVLLDCFAPHAYYSDCGWECVWCHFDGPAARGHYTAIVSHLGNVFSMADPFPVFNKLTTIYNTFYTGTAVREALMSKYLTDILTAFLLYSPTHINAYNYTNMAEEIISYITEHFSEDIRVEQLADRAGLSPYHFIRTFKKETGFTPHEYVVHTRISTAKYLLKNSLLSVKDICFQTGFSCESVFCSAFKKYVGVTPLNYRDGS